MFFFPLIFVTILLSNTVTTAQQATPDFSVADKYFKTYVAGKISKLEPLMSESFRFQDTVSDFKGKKNAIKGLKQVFENLTMGSFKEQTRFRSGRTAVYVGKIQFTYKVKFLR